VRARLARVRSFVGGRARTRAPTKRGAFIPAPAGDWAALVAAVRGRSLHPAALAASLVGVVMLVLLLLKLLVIFLHP